MKKKPHPHIITLLVTYEYDEKFHLLFPLADCDLLQYWKTGNKSQAHNDEGTARWLAQQCHGLTSALRQVQQSSRSSSNGFEERAKLVRRSLFCSELDIHQNMSDPDPRTLVCQHGDLKPQNILLKDRCRLAQRMTFGPLDVSCSSLPPGALAAGHILTVLFRPGQSLTCGRGEGGFTRRRFLDSQGRSHWGGLG